MSAHWNYTSHLLVHLSLETLSPPLHLGQCYNISRIWSWSCRPVLDSRILLFNVHFNSTLARLQAPPHSGSGYVCSHGASCYAQTSHELETFCLFIGGSSFIFKLQLFILHLSIYIAFSNNCCIRKNKIEKIKTIYVSTVEDTPKNNHNNIMKHQIWSKKVTHKFTKNTLFLIINISR